MLNLPNLTSSSNINSSDISTYLRNSLHFLLLLNRPIKPGMGLDPLNQLVEPSDEYFVYRMLWFRELANLYLKDSSPNDISNRLYIESFVERFFNVSAEKIFDDIKNQSYYAPTVSTSPTTIINGQPYSTEQLDYIFQSLTLDIACHTTALTPKHILTCYSQDFQEAIERTEPIRLIALNLNQVNLSVRQSEAFEKYIHRLLSDTQGFIQYLEDNDIPKTYIDCYQFNVIEQLVHLQLDIINMNHSGKYRDNYSLVNLWFHIDDYLSSQPYSIPAESTLSQIFNAFRQDSETYFPDTQIDELKNNVKGLLLTPHSKPIISSIWASGETHLPTGPSAIGQKNL